MKRYITCSIVFSFLFAVALPARAATFEVSGWIPWWRSATGTQEALQHLNVLTEINPFGFTVKRDGELVDTLGIDKTPWPAFIASAQAKHVRVVPTITWSDGQAMDVVLGTKVLRDAEIADIVAMVKKYNFDGVDVDYEAKLATTNTGFSLFLQDLYKAMGKKFVDCDIESRTPVTSRYDTVPANYKEEYANDYIAINKYCDRVRIMAYDQRNVDVKLNEANIGPYQPVADPQWVTKVINLAAQTISKKKIVLGIPTYGYEYQLGQTASGSYTYKLLWAFNQKYAVDIAQSLGIVPQRNSAGELSFVTADQHLLWWSDSKAITDKIALAHKLGLRGVAFFKIDGGADPGIWNVLQ